MIETEGLTGAETLLRVLSHMGVDRIFSSPAPNGRRCGKLSPKPKRRARAYRCISARATKKSLSVWRAATPNPRGNFPRS